MVPSLAGGRGWRDWVKNALCIQEQGNSHLGTNKQPHWLRLLWL
jgi:hypothetical protein